MEKIVRLHRLFQELSNNGGNDIRGILQSLNINNDLEIRSNIFKLAYYNSETKEIKILGYDHFEVKGLYPNIPITDDFGEIEDNRYPVWISEGGYKLVLEQDGKGREG